ncbi:MAG: PAS domain-containing protein [Desulfobacterales bacterium]|nr:PAS domain-containing protein [Desulfobacterales bacterium]
MQTDLATATFLKVNPAFTETLGYSEQELLAQPYLELVHPDDVAATVRVIEDRLRQGRRVFNFKNRYRCKAGGYRWLDWVSHPIPGKGILVAVARDSTDLPSWTASRM